MTPPKPSKRGPAHEIKVKIPVRHHLKLQSTKILTGRKLSAVVEDALEAYLAKYAFPEGGQ